MKKILILILLILSISIPLNADERSVDNQLILETLRRCREFIDDYSNPIFEYGSSILLYELPPSRFDYLNSNDKEEIIEIENRIKKRERERELREDIENIIKFIEGGIK